jgi:hypothetical protein
MTGRSIMFAIVATASRRSACTQGGARGGTGRAGGRWRPWRRRGTALSKSHAGAWDQATC